MSRRWQGCLQSPQKELSGVVANDTHQEIDIAGRYAALLESLHSKCLNEPELKTSNLFHFNIITGLDTSQNGADEIFDPATAPQDAPVSREKAADVEEFVLQQRENNSGAISGQSPSSNRDPTSSVDRNGYTNPVNLYRPNTIAQSPVDLGLNGSGTSDELTMMSNMLLDNQFLQMDRVITLDETDFAWDWTYTG